MAITIRRAQAEDAQAILELTKIMGRETDNLSFGEEGIPSTVEEESAYLCSIAHSEKNIFLVAFKDGELVGTAQYSTLTKKRMAHRGGIGISIQKSAWGIGIGSMLMERLLDFAKDTAQVEIISLEVRSDNQQAINLYNKFGFKKIGCFKGYFKINNALVDFDIMEKFLSKSK